MTLHVRNGTASTTYTVGAPSQSRYWSKKGYSKGARQSYPSSYCRKNSRSTAVQCKRPLKPSPAPDQFARGTTCSRCTVSCPSRCAQKDSKMTRAISRRMRDNPELGRHSRSSMVVHPPHRRHPEQSKGAEGEEKKTSCQRRGPTVHLRPGRTREGRIGQALVWRRVEYHQLDWVHVCDDGDSEMPRPGGWQMHSI